MIVSPKFKYLTATESIELANILCSSKSSIRGDSSKILQSMLDRGLSEIEAKKIIKVFNDKISCNEELKLENSCAIYNIDGFSPIICLVINYVLAANNNPILNHYYDQNTIQLIEEELQQTIYSSTEESIVCLNSNKICFVNNKLIHPYSTELNTANKEALLIKSLIRIANIPWCIIYCADNNIMNLAMKSSIKLEFQKIMTISKNNEKNIIYYQIYENSTLKEFAIDTDNYGIKLTKNNVFEKNEGAAIIKSICIGYNSIYKGEITLLTSLILHFMGKSADINEGMYMTKAIFENNKIAKLIKNY